MSGGGLHHVQETEVTGSQTPNFDDWVKAASDDNHETVTPGPKGGSSPSELKGEPRFDNESDDESQASNSSDAASFEDVVKKLAAVGLDGASDPKENKSSKVTASGWTTQTTDGREDEQPDPTGHDDLEELNRRIDAGETFSSSSDDTGTVQPGGTSTAAPLRGGHGNSWTDSERLQVLVITNNRPGISHNDRLRAFNQHFGYNGDRVRTRDAVRQEYNRLRLASETVRSMTAKVVGAGGAGGAGQGGADS